jgi:hypothetical protein
MNATCTEARERAPTTTDSAAEESWQLLMSSETPCPKLSSRATAATPGNKPGRTSSEMGKVGNIVSAEREGRFELDTFWMPAIEYRQTQNHLPRLWAIIMPEIATVRDSKCPTQSIFWEIGIVVSYFAAVRGRMVLFAVRNTSNNTSRTWPPIPAAELARGPAMLRI